MTGQQFRDACAAFVEAGWITERSSRGPRYALPGTLWRGRVGDIYVMLYRVEGQYADDRHYVDPRDLARLATALAHCAREKRRKLARHARQHATTPGGTP